jgi:hypothetical protein
MSQFANAANLARMVVLAEHHSANNAGRVKLKIEQVKVHAKIARKDFSQIKLDRSISIVPNVLPDIHKRIMARVSAVSVVLERTKHSSQKYSAKHVLLQHIQRKTG